MKDTEQNPDRHGVSGRVLPISPSSHGSFVTKDSGQRETYSTGMVRDVQDGKARHDLLWPVGVPYEEQFLTRVAQLLARGAEKYGERNWEKARTQEEIERFRASGARHFAQWLAGELDEDHAAAVVFNLLAFETTAHRMRHRGEPGPQLVEMRGDETVFRLADPS